MTLETLFSAIQAYRVPIVLIVLAAPWLTYLICYFIPGRREEPFVLSVNLGLAVFSLLLWASYLAYATNTGGWQLVVKQADIALLCLPLYYIIASLWISRQRIPLQMIPAFRTLQGIAMLAGTFLLLSWLAGRIRLIFFSYLPLTVFLCLLAILLGLGYAGYRRIVDE
ncbi:MAG: hypothetical protein F6K19_07860 [Cyanothece sp. SIO1E1]|nr:hypothetical protein [Cyanothece sp. SIO1E1]